jgi:hypothetical protein
MVFNVGILTGALLGAWGLWGVMTGSTTIHYKSGAHRYRPLFTYQGRELGALLTIAGIVLLFLGLAGQDKNPYLDLTAALADRYAFYTLVATGVLTAVFCVLNPRSSSSGSEE